MLFLTQRAPGHSPIGPSLHLDLAEANRRQLLEAGLKPTAIKWSAAAQAVSRNFSSPTAPPRATPGRSMAVIGIRAR